MSENGRNRLIAVVDELMQNRKPNMDVPPSSSEREPDHHSNITPSSLPSPWLTVKEGAARARCGPRQLYEAVQRGTLRAVRVGRDGRGGYGELRFRDRWIDEWLESMPASGRATR